MKKVIAILITLVMVLTVAGCTGGKPGNTDDSNLPSDFSTWTEVEMVNYLKAEGVFTHEDWLYVEDESYLPVGITKMISYIDDYGDADIMILWLKADNSIARTEEIYNEIKTTHNYIMTEAGNAPCPFNAMFGRFAILYSFSLDTELVEKCEAALDKLTSEYGVTPEFYEKEIEMPEYDDDYDDADPIVEE